MATDTLRSPRDERSFLLQRVQPAMTGLIDGSLSTLAPILSVAIATHRPHYAFFAGLATAIGAGVSMAFSDGLSDTGDLTGRGNPYVRGSITGIGTFLGGIVHTLPFLISEYRIALAVAVIVIAFELMSSRSSAGAFSTPGSCARSPRSRSAERSSRRAARRSGVRPGERSRQIDRSASPLAGRRGATHVPAMPALVDMVQATPSCGARRMIRYGQPHGALAGRQSRAPMLRSPLPFGSLAPCREPGARARVAPCRTPAEPRSATRSRLTVTTRLTTPVMRGHRNRP
jgi:hypothetical protein